VFMLVFPHRIEMACSAWFLTAVLFPACIHSRTSRRSLGFFASCSSCIAPARMCLYSACVRCSESFEAGCLNASNLEQAAALLTVWPAALALLGSDELHPAPNRPSRTIPPIQRYRTPAPYSLFSLAKMPMQSERPLAVADLRSLHLLSQRTTSVVWPDPWVTGPRCCQVSIRGSRLHSTSEQPVEHDVDAHQMFRGHEQRGGGMAIRVIYLHQQADARSD